MSHFEPLRQDNLAASRKVAAEKLGEARQAIRQEAVHLAAAAQDRARSELEKGRQSAARAIHAFADALSRAGDDLTEASRDKAARGAGQAAVGLQVLSRTLAAPRGGLGRPIAFAGAALLVGVALSQFARRRGEPGAQARPAADLTDETGAADPWPVDEPASFIGAGDDLEVSTEDPGGPDVIGKADGGRPLAGGSA